MVECMQPTSTSIIRVVVQTRTYANAMGLEAIACHCSTQSTGVRSMHCLRHLFMSSPFDKSIFCIYVYKFQEHASPTVQSTLHKMMYLMFDIIWYRGYIIEKKFRYGFYLGILDMSMHQLKKILQPISQERKQNEKKRKIIFFFISLKRVGRKKKKKEKTFIFLSPKFSHQIGRKTQLTLAHDFLLSPFLTSRLSLASLVLSSFLPLVSLICSRLLVASLLQSPCTSRRRPPLSSILHLKCQPSLKHPNFCFLICRVSDFFFFAWYDLKRQPSQISIF